MKAVVIRKAGGPEVLKIEKRPIPKATEKETVIHIRAFCRSPL
jgi:NADPH:quinone reductase and related Zn-dependent oxidoreductases